MAYSIQYFFEEDSNRIDGFLIEELISQFKDCRIKKLISETKTDLEQIFDLSDNDEDYFISFCELEIICDTLESFESIQQKIEKKYGIVPFRTEYKEK
jgi:hypothetical protein